MGKIYRNGELVGFAQPGWEWLSEVASHSAKSKTLKDLGSHPSAYALGVAMKAEYQRKHPELFPEPEKEAPQAPKFKKAPVADGEKKFLTPDDLAARYSVERDTIYLWKGDNKLPPTVEFPTTGTKTNRRMVRWALADIEEFERNLKRKKEQ